MVLGTAAAVLALSVALAPGLVARLVLASRLSQALGTPVRLGWASWNPFSGRWTIRSVRVAADTGRPGLSARRITVRAYLTDAVRRRLRVRDLALEAARVRLRAPAPGGELPRPPPRQDATPPRRSP